MSFPDTLAAAIRARIEQITAVNGYRTDIGLHVFDGRRRIDDSHLPFAVIVEEDEDPLGQQGTNAKVAVGYAVEAAAACDPDHPNVVGRDIVADIKRAIWSGDTSFGNRVIALEYRGRTIEPREDGLDIVSARVEFGVVYAGPLAEG